MTLKKGIIVFLLCPQRDHLELQNQCKVTTYMHRRTTPAQKHPDQLSRGSYTAHSQTHTQCTVPDQHSTPEAVQI